jgi:hypothetical protein
MDFHGQDTSAVDALEAEFRRQRETQHDAEMAKIHKPLEAAQIEAKGKADALTIAANAKARLLGGVALMATGAGVGLAAFGLSYLLKPQADIKWVGDQIALNGVLGPHLTGPQGIQGVQGIKGEPGIQGLPGRDGINGRDGANIAAPQIGQPMTIPEMESRSDYRSAASHGRIVSITNGRILLDTGVHFDQLDSDFKVMNWTTDRLNGMPAYCRKRGSLNPRTNRPLYDCYTIYNGLVSDLNPISSEVF